MGHYRDVQQALAGPARELRSKIGGTYEGFAQMHRSALADGALPGKVKELMALAISVVEQCDGCIAAHARGAARRGASEEEVVEALAVAILMAGGPATVYGPHALEAFQEFSATAR
jgi:AhpD family alkylhydroperoxidase